MKYQKCGYGKGNNKHINFPRLKHRRLEGQPCSTNICAHQVSTAKYHVLNGLFFIIFQNWSWQQSYNTLVKVRNKVNNSVGYYSLLCDWRFKIKQIHCAQNRMEVLCLHSLVDPWGPGDPTVTFWGTRKIVLGSKNRREGFFQDIDWTIFKKFKKLDLHQSKLKTYLNLMSPHRMLFTIS